MQEKPKPRVPHITFEYNHEVLPHKIERALPYSVIDNIYSFLRRKYDQNPRQTKIERHKIELNDKIMKFNELLKEQRRRKALREKKAQQHDKLLEALNALSHIIQNEIVKK